jgi:bifunctional non-homologous end joining protein LigD
MQEANISLYQKHGSTDKEYHAQLKPEGNGWDITMQNGRRGGTLTPRRKFETPVSYEVARKEYDKLVRSKVSDGYSEGEAGVAFQDSPFEARFTGNVPQLYNEASAEEVDSYYTDSDWVLQEKWDGHRRLTQRTGADIIGSNRKGLQVALPQPVVASFDCIADEGDVLFDGEILGGSLVVIFDVLIVNGKDIRNEPLKSRLVHLERIKAKLEAAGAEALMATYTARTEAEKRTHHAALKENAREGGMWKRLDGVYKPGRPSSGGNQMKNPFSFRATFIAGKMNKTKRSVKIFGLEKGKEVPLGNCTVPPNYDLPTEGALVDIEYKYVIPGGSVFQPRYKGMRDDVDREDCDVSRLRYKETPPGDEDEESEADAEVAVA